MREVSLSGSPAGSDWCLFFFRCLRRSRTIQLNSPFGEFGSGQSFQQYTLLINYHPYLEKKVTDPKHKRQQETAWLNVMTAIPVFGAPITLDSFTNCVSFHNTDAHRRAQKTRGSRLLNNHPDGSRDLITVQWHVGCYSCHHENKVIIQIEMRKVWIVFRFRITLSKNTRGWY